MWFDESNDTVLLGLELVFELFRFREVFFTWGDVGVRHEVEDSQFSKRLAYLENSWTRHMLMQHFPCGGPEEQT
jgi:hypothetical protein